MNVSDEMRMTVAFVCAKKADGTLSPRGTAFFVGHQASQSPYSVSVFAVTARHVIEGIRDRLGVQEIYLTYNDSSGRQEYETSIRDWVFHSEETEEFVDVALTPMSEQVFALPAGPHAVNPLKVRYWLTRSIVSIMSGRQTRLQSGQEVGITGLFVHHTGSNSNVPIVRCGTIAATPSELIKTRLGPMTALLIELRSVGGLSGSPVFVNTQGSVYLIGLIHGHYDHNTSDMDDATDDIEFATERINAGIGIVVPADRIRELLFAQLNGSEPVHDPDQDV